jgi:hypothetical protein
MPPEGQMLIRSAKEAAPLELGNDAAGEVLQRAGEVGEDDVEAIGRFLFEPDLDMIGDLVGGTDDRPGFVGDLLCKLADGQVERRVLLDEFLKEITILPDYIDVNIHGAPPIHVLYQEVGLKESEFDRVGGPTWTRGPRPLGMENPWSDLSRAA